MTNCHDDILAFHAAEVTLPQSERYEMIQRRKTNRDRLTKGLRRDGQSQPFQIRSQGSYSMYTMVQQSDKDYDIDDGVYFRTDDLPDGNRTSPRRAKDLVRSAVHSGNFKNPPEVRKNCVRIYYNEGYHIDLPVYRRPAYGGESGTSTNCDEIAGPDWNSSDPIAVVNWFLEENKRQSPDSDDGGQLRRMVRFVKAFARSRPTWRSRMPSGFIITKLLTECYQPNADREDASLYATMKVLRYRLSRSPVVHHPLQPETLTKGPTDKTTDFLRQRLAWALDVLRPLRTPNCSRADALSAWGRVFDTDFFGNRPANEASGSGSGGSSRRVRRPTTPARPVDKRGSGTFA